ncbi:MAG: CPBP family intramembrane metalloprotease [Desulfobacter sp.]|nr:MAG: CPBP family intramembrane metalloprotease [Desulfobacter sp.]
MTPGRHILFSTAAVLFIEGLAALLPASPHGLHIALARPAQAAALILIFLKTPSGLSPLGLFSPLLYKGIKTGILWSAALGITTLASGALMVFLDRPVVGFFPSGPFSFSLLFTACVSGPLTEELFFRGVVHNWLRRYGRPLATGGSALFFALCHGGPELEFLPLIPFAGGLVFALAFERSESLAAPLIIHMAGNGFLFLGGYLSVIH